MHRTVHTITSVTTLTGNHPFTREIIFEDDHHILAGPVYTSELESEGSWGFTSSFVRAKLNKQNFKLDEQTKLALKFFKHPCILSGHEVVQPIERSFSLL